MTLTDQQRKFQEDTIVTTQQEMEELDSEIEALLAKTKDRLAGPQNAKKTARQMYGAARLSLGIPNKLAANEGTATVVT
jgi:hypothetical protein